MKIYDDMALTALSKDFWDMINIARNELSSGKEQCGQIIVLYLNTHEIQHYCVGLENREDVENCIIEDLLKKNNIVISKILCVWSDGIIDLPSYYLRKKLCELNENNINCEILLSGVEGVNTRTILQTL